MHKAKCLIIAILTVLLCVLSVHAQGSRGNIVPVIDQIEESGLITINMPENLIPVLSYSHNPDGASSVSVEKTPEQSSPSVKVGYRVQVFDDNNPRTAKTQAQERKLMIENRFPEFQGYVTFNSPYWRVKVGDFRTRSEAEAAMGAIRSAFPSIGSQLRVVRDKINAR